MTRTLFVDHLPRQAERTLPNATLLADVTRRTSR